MKKVYFMIVWYIFVICKLFVIIWHNCLSSTNKVSRFFKIKAENFIFFSPRVYKLSYIKKEVKNSCKRIRLFTKDMVRLHAEYLPPAENNDYIVLFFHGQSENITKWQSTYLFLKRLGLGALFLSYRGHYKSAGRPSEKGLYIDAETAMNYLKEQGFSSEKVILWGRSMGSAVAIQTALKYNVKSVILESPIENITVAAISVFERYIKIFKFIFLKHFIRYLLENANYIQCFDNLSKIGKVNCPILIMHAKNDNKINYEQSEHLATASNNAKLILEEDGSHDKAEWCFPYVEEFLKGVLVNK